MDTKICENCGEQLYGAVNRCWKCGQEIALALKLQKPPVRRSPVMLRSAAGLANELGSVPATPLPSIATAVLASPHLPSVLTVRLTHVGYHRCAVGSLALGIAACLLALFSPWAIALAVPGLALGVKGMEARRRDLATMGIIICVLASFLVSWKILYGFWVRYAARQMIQNDFAN